MGWFDEQVRERMLNDDEVFADAFSSIAGAVLGTKITQALRDEGRPARDSIDEILKFYHVKSRDIPASITDTSEQLEFLLRPSGIMRRNVILEKGWYRDAVGAMLGVFKTGEVVAFIPTGMSGYSYTDPKTGKRVKIGRKNEKLFEREAVAFCKPFPLKELKITDLLRYLFETLTAGDIALVVLTTLCATLVAMLLPRLNNILFGEVVQNGSLRLLWTLATFLVCVSVSSILFNTAKNLAMSRIKTKMDTAVEAATMMRILSLPADFFTNYSSGELSEYSGNISTLCDMLVDSLLSTGITSVFSLAYISQISVYAPELTGTSMLIILCTVVVSAVSTVIGMKINRDRLLLSAKNSGLTYALITGVQKIRLAGAEKRAFARWGKSYAECTKLTYSPPVFLQLNGTITTAISLIGTIVLYYKALASGISTADYYAFLSAYGMVSGAFSSFAGMALEIANIKPVLEVAKPLLRAKPEISEGKEVLSRISGGIELSNVSFRYNESMPNVLDNLSLKIKPGQYVAIVGKTGCGKSTLVRLLLGFERPQKGAAYYDGKDMAKIDPKSLRKRMGVVMQNGKLFQGDIFENITISAPGLTLDDAWEAAEIAGLAEDIRRMPMGMNTLIGEGEGGISGGQKQRLLIARAIAPKPKILIFDEATSALDNITQKKVSDALDSLKCTRIVIAHRLSTIRHCDRIIVLEGGRIIEDGTYEQLIEQKGFFADLVERQRLDKIES